MLSGHEARGTVPPFKSKQNRTLLQILKILEEISNDKEVTGVSKLLTGCVYIPQVAIVELDLLTLI